MDDRALDRVSHTIAYVIVAGFGLFFLWALQH